MAELPTSPRAELSPQSREAIVPRLRTIAETQRSTNNRAALIRNLSPKHSTDVARGRDLSEIVIDSELDKIAHRKKGVEGHPQLPEGEGRKLLFEEFKQMLQEATIDPKDRTLPMDILAQAFLAEKNIAPAELLKPQAHRVHTQELPSTEVQLIEGPPRETTAAKLRRQVEEVVSTIKKKTEQGQPPSTAEMQQLQEVTNDLNRRVKLVEDALGIPTTLSPEERIQDLATKALADVSLTREEEAQLRSARTQGETAIPAEPAEGLRSGYPLAPHATPLTDRIRANEEAQTGQATQGTADQTSAQVTSETPAGIPPVGGEQPTGFFRQHADQLRGWVADQQAARTSPATGPITESDIAAQTQRTEPAPANDETARWNRLLESLRQPWHLDRGMTYVPQMRMQGEGRRLHINDALARFGDVNSLEDWKRTRQARGEPATFRAWIEQREGSELAHFDETLATEREEFIRRQIAFGNSSFAYKLFDARLTPDNPYYQRTMNLFPEEADAIKNNLSQLWERYAQQRTALPDSVSPEDSTWIDQMASEMQPYVARRAGSQPPPQPQV